MTTDADEDRSPGWEAIEERCVAVYGDQTPQHYGTIIKFMLGGPDPIDGFSCYRASEPDHWHIVTFGFSELYTKELPDPEVSGYGFELTMRVERHSEQPPMWALHFLQNVARYVFSTGNVFAAGHHMHLNGPIAIDEDTLIHSVIFVEDHDLGTIHTPHGQLDFLQVVGVTNDEREAAEAWDTQALGALMRSANPNLVTLLNRKSHLDDPDFAQAVEAGKAADGSNTGTLFIAELNFDLAASRLTIGAIAVEPLRTYVAGRIPYGNGLLLQGREEIAVGLAPGDEFAVAENEHGLIEVTLPRHVADELVSTLKPVRGIYTLTAAPLTIEVRPTEVRDHHNEVTHVVG